MRRIYHSAPPSEIWVEEGWFIFSKKRCIKDGTRVKLLAEINSLERNEKCCYKQYEDEKNLCASAVTQKGVLQTELEEIMKQIIIQQSEIDREESNLKLLKKKRNIRVKEIQEKESLFGLDIDKLYDAFELANKFIDLLQKQIHHISFVDITNINLKSLSDEILKLDNCKEKDRKLKYIDLLTQSESFGSLIGVSVGLLNQFAIQNAGTLAIRE